MTQTPPQGPNAPLNERVAELLLKAIAAGGLTAGGANAFWQLTKDDGSIPKAIASAVIGLGIAYGTTLLKPIDSGNRRRLEQAGQVIDQTIDRRTEQVTTRLSGFEDWYLQCQAWDCQSYRPEGVPQQEGIFTPMLEEVFVPLALDLSSTLPGFRAAVDSFNPKDLERVTNLNIWHFLRKAEQTRPFRQLVILAWGGYGKTTLLKHIAYLYGTKQHGRHDVKKRIPVLLVLRKYRDLLASENAPELPTLITQHHIPSLPKEGDDRPVPENWATTMLRRGDAVIMLDGFDEVAKDQRPAVAKWINAQMRCYGNSIFIVTSRPKAYRDQDAAHRLELSTPLWVRDFNANQRRDFVTRWYQCQERYAHGGRDTPDVKQLANEAAQDLLRQIEDRQELKDLAKNPLLLNMIVTFHRRYPGARLPQRRVELYRDICQLQLRDRPRARQLDTLLTQCEAQTILQMLALYMMQQRQERISQADLRQVLIHSLQQQEETIDPDDFLDQVVQISELLVQQEDEYEFAHLSFQEYLAAAEVARTQRETLLYDCFDDDWWKPTILLYAAQIKPARLLRKMIEQGATDLAYTCWQDKTKQLDPALEDELKGLKQTVAASRYQQLEQYLKNGQWQEADRETKHLMITAVGKEEGQYFESDDLLNFPCDELLAIDGLWVQYSQGKFGFSVQKEIYLSTEVGGIADGRYHEKAFERFGDRVAWREKDKWAFRIKYDTSAPKGHLPFSVGWGVYVSGHLPFWFGVGVLGGFSLLSHSDL
ncbi:GUN4 domain-containing protein [Nodosilinea sp. LEGE 07088]|uniref:GUN4 domain-containing protein n=1 Tax=Nodosilinea sp. LEGE 07088 TaxID=2777968 RepID=UPI001880C2E0|nr:GUN4 domain-containing protein [Nodosilinea sp. LEGE 07088]MBE9138051.1 GUN4 domain-containing protein [Nodosilinea sp. LEGE 07088]